MNVQHDTALTQIKLFSENHKSRLSHMLDDELGDDSGSDGEGSDNGRGNGNMQNEVCEV